MFIYCLPVIFNCNEIEAYNKLCVAVTFFQAMRLFYHA